MFPIRDNIRSSHFPIVNTVLIGINILVFLIELSYPGDLNEFILKYGLVPARYTIPQIAEHFTAGEQMMSLFTFMFLHGSFWHILGNMWFLYIFGDNIEDRLGSVHYLLFYLLCGWASGITHLATNLDSQMPTIGASGAIAGVMGAYFVLFPRSRIVTLIPILFIPYFAEVPAVFFLGFWLFIQFVSASAADVQASGIAWWAHIGGFVIGAVFVKVATWIPGFGLNERIRRYTARESTPRLQVAETFAYDGDPNLYGTVVVSSREAASGTRKMVSIPRGGRKRLFFVDIPAGITRGTRLRLSDAGKQEAPADKGNVYLDVIIQDE